MKIVIAGGSGQLGGLLSRYFQSLRWEVVVLSRGGATVGRRVQWDGVHLGPWRAELEGARAVINLAGRSVNCRHTEKNLRAMMASRVDSTRILGEAIGAAQSPPAVWLQMSTATIYAHRRDCDQNEATGTVGGHAPDAPASWARSVAIAQACEGALMAARTPNTRKVAMRTSMVMSPEQGGLFSVLSQVVRCRLGGAIGAGDQFVSWIHGEDFARACLFILEHEALDGPVNLTAPSPLPQRDFMAYLRRAWGVGLGLPATAWMVKIGAWVLRTNMEVLLQSRRVVPARLVDAGFVYRHATWPAAAQHLAKQQKSLQLRFVDTYIALTLLFVSIGHSAVASILCLSSQNAKFIVACVCGVATGLGVGAVMARSAAHRLLARRRRPWIEGVLLALSTMYSATAVAATIWAFMSGNPGNFNILSVFLLFAFEVVTLNMVVVLGTLPALIFGALHGAVASRMLRQLRLAEGQTSNDV